MTERPILFSSPMVLALRENRKTVTRRTRGLDKINADPDAWEYRGVNQFDEHSWSNKDGWVSCRCPYGAAGDKLWTREAFAIHSVRATEYGIGFRADHPTGDLSKTDGGYNWRGFSDIPEEAGLQWNWAQMHQGGERWIPSIHMPRWASRDTLEVVSARPERLQATTKADAIAEGIQVLVSTKDCPPGKASPILPISRRVDSHPLWLNSETCHEDDWYTGYYALLWEELNGAGSWSKNPWVWRVEFRRLTA